MKLSDVSKYLMFCLLTMSVGLAAQESPESEADFAPGFFDELTDKTQEDYDGGERNGPLPLTDRVETIDRGSFMLKPSLSFPQTNWNECSDPLTGNYLESQCVAGRNISVILDEYLQARLLSCVDAGLRAQGGGFAQQVHLVHAGISGDPAHSPQSLHSFNRAIDIKVVKVLLTTGERRQFTYSKLGNRDFYRGLRECWGTTVHAQNGCPYIDNDPVLTGSIGWENKNHGSHMHLSVPYCYNGQYGSGVYRR